MKPTVRLALELVRDLERKVGPCGYLVALYGSVARGEPNPRDIDLLLVPKYPHAQPESAWAALASIGATRVDMTPYYGYMNTDSQLWAWRGVTVDVSVREIPQPPGWSFRDKWPALASSGKAQSGAPNDWREPPKEGA